MLLGCVIARIQDKAINIRQPYVNQGPNAFNGRTLDERVINPFLQDNRIPSSKGPYLNVFRRSVEFNESTRGGVRDKKAYDAFLVVLSRLQAASDDSSLQQVLRYLLYRFLELREKASVPLARIQRMSLEQFEALISGLLETPSGGRLPVLLVVATFTTIKEFFKLDWEISYQGINVADIASGAGGDITIKRGDRILMAAEVTERPVDRARVLSTFSAKIAPIGIEDYLFFVRPGAPTADALQQVRQYFAQGHEVNFLTIKDWTMAILATIGSDGRALFTKTLLELLDSPDTPVTLRVSWDQQVERVITV